MMIPKIGDSLAGRIEIHNLWPLSQDEINGTCSNFLHTLVDTDKNSNVELFSILGSNI